MKADSLLFRVLIERTKSELDLPFIAASGARTLQCVQELLAIVGYQGSLVTQLGQRGSDWYLAFRVRRALLVQLDLVSQQQPTGSAAEAADRMVEAAVIALARFHREVQPVIAARLHETLKQLKSADPRVIAALARQPGNKLTVLRDDGELELKIQSQSHRTLATQVETFFGRIASVGYVEMAVIPFNKRSRSLACIHPIRVRIPKSLQDQFNPVSVLSEFVQPQKKVQIQVRYELVVRKRQHLTGELVAWPPCQLEN